MRRLTRVLHRDDRGSALVSVVGIVLVTIVIAVTIASTTVSSLERTDETRDTVAAEFAAEAGVAVVQSAILARTCTTDPVFASGTAQAPFYRAVVQHRVGASFQTGCPTGREDIRIVSTGYDTRADYESRSGTRRSVEALYAQIPQPFAPTGPAVFSYGNISFEQNSTIVAAPGEDVALMSFTGDFLCDNSSAGAADIIVRDGGFAGSNSCSIGGELWVTGTPSGPAPTGSLVVGQATLGNGTSVGGKVVAHSLVIPTNHSGTLGPLFADDTTGVAAGQMTEHGPVASRAAGGTAPSVPGWVDFDLNAADWAGFEVVSAGGCTSSAIENVMASRHGRKVVIDATHCDWLALDNSLDLAITDDLAIFARSFQLKQVTIEGTGDEQLWLITPDTVRDGVPTCTTHAGKKGIEVDDTLEVGTNTAFPDLAVMFYTPCALSFGQPLTVDGQIFAADVSVNNKLTFSYSPAGLPGQNLDTGAADTPPTERALTSYLNTTVTAESIIGGAG
jgi:Tfp pilus assembly protein PilX